MDTQMKKYITIILLLITLDSAGAVRFSLDEVLIILHSYSHPAEIKRIFALIDGYGPYFQKIEQRQGDVAFQINGSWIYYRNGKMLSEQNLSEEAEYHSVFYPYRNGALTDCLPYNGQIPRRSHDFLDALFGKTEKAIRKHCRLLRFLNHKVYMNHICMDALKKIEQKILSEARTDTTVRSFLDGLDIFYSFQTKGVVGSKNRSYHAYGLAVDLVPKDYDGKHVYWKWSSVFNKQWYEIPQAERWQPPQTVIEAFEAYGFVWGGKWPHFDMIHFEYRPEIIRFIRFDE